LEFRRVLFRSLRPRSDTNHLVIDRQYIEERKAIAEIQLGSIFSYLKNDDCRSRKLLSYFGETESADCLICDVCIQKRKAERNEELESKIYLQITHLLMDGPLTLDELIEGIENGDEKAKLDFIRRLIDSGEIKMNNGKYYQKQ